MGRLQSAVASGTIFPGRFVKLDSTLQGQVLQCGSGDTPIGISDLGGRRSPYIDQTNPQPAANINEPIRFWDLDSECGLEVVAAVTPGQRLKPDTNGKGTPTTAATDQYGAVAINIAAAGYYCKVKVSPGEGQ
jgi:hypothetical protein